MENKMNNKEISRDGDKSKAADRAPCSSVAGSICNKLSTAYQAFLRWFKPSSAVNIAEGVVTITKADIAPKINRSRAPAKLPEVKVKKRQRKPKVTSQTPAKTEIAPKISRSKSPAKLPEVKVRKRSSRMVINPTITKTEIAPKINQTNSPEVEAKKRRSRTVTSPISRG